MKRLAIHITMIIVFLGSLIGVFLHGLISLDPYLFAEIHNEFVFLSLAVLFILYMRMSREKIRREIRVIFQKKRKTGVRLILLNDMVFGLSVVILMSYLFLYTYR